MSRSTRILACLAALSLCVSTALGAYASHGLEAVLDAARLSSFRTAVEYQFYHGLGLLAVALLADRYPDMRLLRVPGWLLVGGIVLFSGSIYATSMGAPRVLGMAAPVGGISFIGAWLVLLFALWRLPGRAVGTER